VGPMAGLDAAENYIILPCRETRLGSSVVQPVIKPTELSWRYADTAWPTYEKLCPTAFRTELTTNESSSAYFILFQLFPKYALGGGMPGL
jgi:hypothetical protein